MLLGLLCGDPPHVHNVDFGYVEYSIYLKQVMCIHH